MGRLHTECFPGVRFKMLKRHQDNIQLQISRFSYNHDLRHFELELCLKFTNMIIISRSTVLKLSYCCNEAARNFILQLGLRNPSLSGNPSVLRRSESGSGLFPGPRGRPISQSHVHCLFYLFFNINFNLAPSEGMLHILLLSSCVSSYGARYSGSWQILHHSFWCRTHYLQPLARRARLRAGGERVQGPGGGGASTLAVASWLLWQL